ncbi:hypothetical protein AB0I53_27250 [Saccharopolyspora sp. NPDC050389]|uniref:hypothetical protein n=1 Tax=Saccharopolyspora sp. NPDC050389 TaxID=3155516 RepID=UPI0033E16944
MKTLIIPGEQEFLDQFGEAPEVLEEPWIQGAKFETGNGTLRLSFDQLENSIRFEWRQSDDVLWHFFREGATALSIRAENEETRLVAEFESEELSGEVDVRVYPKIAIKDSLLRS